jgi:HTH-type transcriptional regulator / antitoxin HigA
VVIRNAKAAPKGKEEIPVMTDGSIGEFDELTPAWREFEVHAPVKLRAIETDRHFRAMVKFMDKLVDRIGDQENHPLMGLLDIVTAFVHDYEERNVEIPDAGPAGALRFLMDQHGLRQADLASEFGSQSNVSEVLSGKREINARQARALAKRFGVSPAVFV